jgi:hypothetical protein
MRDWNSKDVKTDSGWGMEGRQTDDLQILVSYLPADATATARVAIFFFTYKDHDELEKDRAISYS